ncbi:Alpha amylase, catalytic domain subfamily, putative [Verrucomicrobiia bacterium DG1235]|nr:Alpha amylase, catalytic domain subfamily, putative [Verrucomicrobiae bacterium DG1235]
MGFVTPMKIALFLLSLVLVVRLAGSSAWVEPEVLEAGEEITIFYDPAGGALAGASRIFVYRAFNDWGAIAGPDQEMELDEETGVFSFSYRVSEAAYGIDFVFRDANDNWDNNGGADWHVAVNAGAGFGELPGPPRLPETASRARVMMQGFYWDVPAGTWYATMAEKAAELRNMGSGQGIDRMWFPPPSKGESGPHSMGYDPYDYFDLGQYSQKGTVRTRFGTQTELKAVLSAYREQGIVCMADIVLNHRSGGAWETNPNTGAAYWTDFSGVASGRATWTYDDFHPSSLELSDEGVFAGFPDVCHVANEGSGDPGYDLVEWGNWLMDTENAGFDGGWRFDYVKGVSPSMIRRFSTGTGNAFGILECWDGMAMIEAYQTVCGGASAFDFPGYYTMRDVFNSATGAGDISSLVDPERVYAARDSEYAVTFVANHDTDEITRNRMLAYAFILTYEGYPCLFWRDYFDRGLADLGGQSGNGIKALVWARGALAGGRPKVEVLQGDDRDLLVYGSRSGIPSAPGYLVAINDGVSQVGEAIVKTGNPYLRGKRLKCYAWFSYAAGQNVQPSDVVCGEDGTVVLKCPARGYAVYGPADLAAPVVEPSGFDSEEGTLSVTVRNTIDSQDYLIEASSDPRSIGSWEEVKAFAGSESDRTEVVLPVEAGQSVLWKVRTVGPGTED